MSLLNHLESKTSNNDKNHLFSNMNGNLNNNKNDNKITMTDTDNISLLSKADIELMDLIKDFFNFQFKMKNAPCPFPSTKENNLKINNNDNNLITTNDNYNHILISLEKMGKLFAEQYHDKLYGMIKKLKLKSNNTNNCAMFHCLSNEIFANGIQWNYIITYFVFSSYFAYYGQQQRVISAEEVAKWLFSYISENLYSWIKNNGNWVRNAIFFSFVYFFISPSLSYYFLTVFPSVIN